MFWAVGADSGANSASAAKRRANPERGGEDLGANTRAPYPRRDVSSCVRACVAAPSRERDGSLAALACSMPKTQDARLGLESGGVDDGTIRRSEIRIARAVCAFQFPRSYPPPDGGKHRRIERIVCIVIYIVV